MSVRPIIDAGPGLNFLSVHRERLLISVLGTISAPETVEAEVFRKAGQEQRFRAAGTVWRKLTPKWMQILSDDITPELASVVTRISGLPMEERLKHPKDLGEIMVIAHAVVAAEAGATVTVLIDDSSGARIAMAEKYRLERRRDQGHAVGVLNLANTLTILARAAGGKFLPDKNAMRDTYRRLRELDDGLPPIDTTNLLSSDLWL